MRDATTHFFIKRTRAKPRTIPPAAEATGQVWAESPGEGMGATFYLEFSPAPPNGNNNVGPADALRPK